jgi:hypothetical protein
MKTLEQEMQELQDKHAEAARELEAKHAVLVKLGDIGEYEPPSVHYFKLYGARGGVHFRYNKYSSLRKGSNPDRALLARLLKDFPPVDRVQVKDGCTSFRPAVTAPGFNRELAKGMSGIKPEETDWRGELLDVFPVTVRLEVFQGPDARFEWYADLDGVLWEFSVEFPLYQTDLGTLDLRYDHYSDGEIKAVDRCDFQPKHGAQRIRWSSGSHKTPNSFTLWWDVDSGKATDFPGLVNLPKATTV